MLTPSKNDPNRKKELKRAKNGEGFGGQPHELPDDWTPSHGLVARHSVDGEFKEDAADTMEHSEKIEVILKALEDLEFNAENFTTNGAPRTEVLEAKTGIVEISAELRDEVFAIHNKMKED